MRMPIKQYEPNDKPKLSSVEVEQRLRDTAKAYGVEVGAVYEHDSGMLFIVVGLACEPGTGNVIVIYRSYTTDTPLWSRNLADFITDEYSAHKYHFRRTNTTGTVTIISWEKK